MKKLFEAVGFITLICLSFVYTEKTVNVVKEYDDIMITIKEKNEEYKIKPKNAKIDKNTIIPGLKGKKINENKSYSKMKRYGSYNGNLLVYDEVKPTISVKNNFDKYIIKGNEEKNMISLIFIIGENDKIDKILKILKSRDIKANFFIDVLWLEKNEEKLIKIIKNGHNVGSIGLNGDYSDSNYPWIDNKIKTTTKKDFSYCYNEVEDINALKICSNYNNYTIRPNIIVSKNPFAEVKEKISPGSIISFGVNDAVENEMSLIIEYIKSKGYTISTLEEHLEE